MTSGSSNSLSSSIASPSSMSAMLFRYRVFVIAGCIVLGFWSPWNRWFGLDATRVWLVVPQELARLHWMSLQNATMLVTILAVGCAVVAALLRTWGTAYLQASVVYDSRMHAEGIVADGPFRYVRNPLYIGTIFHMLALVLLMSPAGAIFVVVAVQIFHEVLVRGEEHLMLAQRGEPYAKYLKTVRRWIPSLAPRTAAPDVQRATSGARPRWEQALLGESYICLVAGLYLALAWRYNAQLLERGILIIFGMRLVLRAIFPAARQTGLKEGERA